MDQDKSSSPPPNPRKPPHPDERRRSRSPRRDTNRHARKEGGFRWKEKRRVDEGEQNADRGGRLERGYKEHYRARSPQQGREPDDREPLSTTADPEPPKKETKERTEKEKKEKKEPKEKKAAADPASGEPMIIVNVNDRLGTKAAIPCFASDPISQHDRSSPS
jgi:hypothetical protein